MASLQQLLAEEGFKPSSKNHRKTSMKLRDRTAPDDSIALPIYICHDRKSSDSSKQKTHKTVTQKGSSVFSSASKSSGNEPPIDEVAIKAVISILNGYTGRFIRDENFRDSIREKFDLCLAKRTKDSDDENLANLVLGIDSIEELVRDRVIEKGKLLRNSIQLLSIVQSLNSKKLRNNSTCGIPNSHLSAFSQFYISIVYKLEKNDRISARHLLQVFCDSPFLARTHLLPDLWEHFFLPHLLHLKVWYHKELEFISNFDYGEKEIRLKGLNKVYNDQMDSGTTLFALYYKQWLKVGAKAPAIPAVPLPSRPSYRSSRRRSLDYCSSRSFINKNLYGVVFGPTLSRRSSLDNDRPSKASIDPWTLEEVKNEVCRNEVGCNNFNFVHNNNTRSRRRSYQENRNPELSKAISTISCSDNLTECEIAIHKIAKTWLNSHGDPTIEAELSKAQVIGGIMEILFSSNDDEILELAISILAELATKSESNRETILKSDPHLEIFMRLLRSNSLFLKAAVLLYLLKPKAKQMISIEWVPLVLRVLEFGDHMQTLFTISCQAQVAAFYFLDQLLHGFDEDKNLENAREVVALGGLGLLVGRIDKGDIHESNKIASFILCCIKADESCQNYLAENLKY